MSLYIDDRIQEYVKDNVSQIPDELLVLLAELHEWAQPFNENLYIGDSIQAGIGGGMIIDSDLPEKTFITWSLYEIGEEGDYVFGEDKG